jgi:hypothetical protein
VGNADPVYIDTTGDLKGVVDVAREIVEDPSINVGTDKKLLKEFLRDLDKISTGTDQVDGNLVRTANPLETFDLIKKYETKAADLGRFRPERAVPNPNDTSLARAYELMADELKDRLYTQSNADVMLFNAKQNDKIIKELAQISPKLAERVKNASTVADLRSIAAPFVRGSKLAFATRAGEQIATNNLGGVAKGLGSLVQNPLNLIALPLSDGGLNAAAGAGLRSLSRGSNPAAEKAAGVGARQAIDLLTRLGVLGVGQNIDQQQAQAGTPAASSQSR